ncbi:hypothetical protein KBC89_00090 [Candidatus Woesebacteria bacterium]|jgi:hypothetical protein|nr:hypothetical protein [Candidatus Woesebacteria bacterium]
MKNIFSKILIALAVVAVMGFTSVSSALAYGDASIYCTGGGYFDKFGPSQYWSEFTSMGWCNAPAGNNWCENGQCAQNSPYNTVTRSMWRTYSGSQQSNYARWNMGNDGGYWYWFAFIPSNYATTSRAPYTITYAGGSQYNFTVNQNAYSNIWVTPGSRTENFTQIMNTWLSDATSESPSQQIGFDEVQKCSEASQYSAYCPGNHTRR